MSRGLGPFFFKGVARPWVWLGVGSSGPAVLWSSGLLVLWSSGFLGPVVLWSSGPGDLWSSGPPVFWSSGPAVLWSFSPRGECTAPVFVAPGREVDTIASRPPSACVQCVPQWTPSLSAPAVKSPHRRAGTSDALRLPVCVRKCAIKLGGRRDAFCRSATRCSRGLSAVPSATSSVWACVRASMLVTPDSCIFLSQRRARGAWLGSSSTDASRPPSTFSQPAASVSRVGGCLSPTFATKAERAAKYWATAREAAQHYARVFYNQEIHAAVNAAAAAPAAPPLSQRLLQGFLTLPARPPAGPECFGLAVEDLFTEEISLLSARSSELRWSRSAVAEACAAPLDVVGLCPFPLAVACFLVSAADSAPEFLLGFFYTLSGWVCHENLHAIFDPIKSDRRTRPRCMVQGICDAAAGKSPFWGGFVSPWFTGVDGQRSVFQTHPRLWSSGGTKGLYVAQATDADLAERTQESSGKMFWASPECWLMLDTSHAKRRANPDKEKVNFHYLLECQNGNDYGPRSMKSRSQQIHVPTTNFGMMLLGQADAVHDFWGQVYSPGSPVRNKGFEGRPLFLFAGAARLIHQEQCISAEVVCAFVKAILLNIASSVGHQVSVDFIRSPPPKIA